MHPYSTNSEERTRTQLYLAGVAVGLAWVGTKFSGLARLPFWVEVPGTATLYGIVYAFFRDLFWQFGIFRWLRFVKVPNLRGEWNGYFTTSYDDAAEKHKVSVEITQNWTHILIKLTADKSVSRSVVGSIFVSDAETVLSYQYENQPSPDAVKTMHAHDGTATLVLGKGRNTLNGNYYSGRDRANQGTLVLTRKGR